MMSELESRLVDPDQIKAFFKRKKALDKAAQARKLGNVLDSIDDDYYHINLDELLRIAKNKKIKLNIGKSNASEFSKWTKAITQLLIAGIAIKKAE